MAENNNVVVRVDQPQQMVIPEKVYVFPNIVEEKDVDGNIVKIERGGDRFTMAQLVQIRDLFQARIDAIEAMETEASV